MFLAKPRLELLLLIGILNLMLNNNVAAISKDSLYIDSLVNPMDSIIAHGYNMVQALPKSYVKDGSVDYTAFLQDAINKHDLLIFPNFPVLLDDKGLSIGSGKRVYFPRGSELLLSPSDKKAYNVIRIQLANNVILINPVIYGDRYTHSGSEGEWGMGIGIYSSRNIRIYNPQVYNCWGDGIYVGDYTPGNTSRNIFIGNANCSHNRRNGISIISVDTLQLMNPVIGYNGATAPMAGIDIEPDNASNEIKNILIQNAKSFFNGGDGICISLSELLDNRKTHSIQINIRNPTDSNSVTGMYISCLKSKKTSLFRLQSNLSGSIIIDNPTWIENSARPFNGYGFRTDDIGVQIVNPEILKADGATLSRAARRALIINSTDKNGKLQVQ